MIQPSRLPQPNITLLQSAVIGDGSDDTGPPPRRRKNRRFQHDSFFSRLWVSQNGICFYCSELMTQEIGGRADSATIDHRVPQCLARGLGFKNQVLACRKCNLAKADALPEEFWALFPNHGWKWIDGSKQRVVDVYAIFHL